MPRNGRAHTQVLEGGEVFFECQLMTQIGQVLTEIVWVLGHRLVFPADFTVFEGAQTTQNAKQAGFANAIVALQVQPLPGR